jgi:hypothetical protein
MERVKVGRMEWPLAIKNMLNKESENILPFWHLDSFLKGSFRTLGCLSKRINVHQRRPYKCEGA